VAPSAAVSENRLFLAQEYSRLVAFDLSATPPAQLWEAHDELPDIASPVAGHGFVWIASTYGNVSCHDAATGELRWRHQYDDGFNASPILAGDTLLLLDLAGNLRFLATGGSFEEQAVLPLGDAAFATPAILNDLIIVRTRTQLLCIARNPIEPQNPR
jgi:outer membrane protein assembly factor BamB